MPSFGGSHVARGQRFTWDGIFVVNGVTEVVINRQLGKDAKIKKQWQILEMYGTISIQKQSPTCSLGHKSMRANEA